MLACWERPPRGTYFSTIFRPNWVSVATAGSNTANAGIGQSSSLNWAYPTLLVSQTFSSILFGRLSDLVGRRWVFVLGNLVAFVGFLATGRVSERASISGLVRIASLNFIFFAHVEKGCFGRTWDRGASHWAIPSVGRACSGTSTVYGSGSFYVPPCASICNEPGNW